MRKGSVYKLNKINRDVEKASSNTQQQKQPIGESLNKYKVWSNGNYLLEDNIEEWKKFSDEKIHDKYYQLKEKLEQYYCKKK